jgi:hypothetical protein
MIDETIYTMEIHGNLYLGDVMVGCPECAQLEGLAVTAFVEDATVSVQCPDRHVWTIDCPGRWVRDLYFESLLDPNRSISIDVEGYGT